MSENFIIRETIDADGQRVIVYEFPDGDTRQVPAAGKGRRSRMPRSSFIKITFGDSPPGEPRNRINRKPGDSSTS